MALRKANQVYTTTGTTEISLEAKADESFLVKGIYVFNPTGASLTLRTGRTNVGFFRTSGALGSHIGYRPGFAEAQLAGNLNALDLAIAKGWHRGFPVPSGYTFTGEGPGQSGAVQSVLYDEYDPGDQRRDMPNGPDSNELDYFTYGNTGATISTAATSAYDTMLNGTEYAGFPWTTVVPSNSTITWFGIFASSFAPSENDGTDDLSTTYLRFTKDREVMFDPDRNGLAIWEALGTQSADQIGGGACVVGQHSATDDRGPFELDPPMVFNGGDEVTVEVSTQIAGSGANMLIADQEVAIACRIARA